MISKRSVENKLRPRDMSNLSKRIEHTVFWIVELWPIAQPRCWLQDYESQEITDSIDNMPIESAKLFGTYEEALEAASQEREFFPDSDSINPTPVKIRRTNVGAESLLEYRIMSQHKLETLCYELGIGQKMAHCLCWGLTIPSLELAGKIKKIANIKLEAWLEPTISTFNPNLRNMPTWAEYRRIVNGY